MIKCKGWVVGAVVVALLACDQLALGIINNGFETDYAYLVNSGFGLQAYKESDGTLVNTIGTSTTAVCT